MTIAADRPTTSSDPWAGFDDGAWRESVDVAAFIRGNYTPYSGDASFLAGPTERTESLWRFVADLMLVERERGILDVDQHTPSTITSHAPGGSPPTSPS